MPERSNVIRDALQLNVKDRATLVRVVLESLEDLGAEDWERLWSEESVRRLEAYQAGEADSIPAEEAHRRANEALS